MRLSHTTSEKLIACEFLTPAIPGCASSPAASIANPDAWNALGLRLAEDGRTRDAIEAFRRACLLNPGAPQPRLNLGVALAQSGQNMEALGEFEQVVEQSAGYLEGHLNLGKSLSESKRYREAVLAFRRALSIDPESVDALNGLGLAWTYLGRAAEATVALRQAVRLAPACAGAWCNLGFAMASLARYAEADQAFCEALRLEPSLAEAHVNRGNALKEQGRLTEAIACYDLALMLNRDAGSARWNRSLALLQLGRFAEGWKEYESRWDRGEGLHRRSYEAPMWDGRTPTGKTILVFSEQGLGDTLMFARYASLLREAGAKVVFEAPAPLLSILASCPAIDQVIPEGSALPTIDAVVPAMSLPRLFGTLVDSIPSGLPYLAADAGRVAACRRAFAADHQFNVGIVWQGNPSHQWDRHRSIPLRMLAMLAAVPSVRLISLQRGPGREQLADCPFPVLDPITDQPTESTAVAELAALISAVDLLITVDTMPAHLAGAMGVPVWVLISTMVDWRWMCDRTDSPWYPTMRLFRQRERDQWTSVIEGIADQLGQVVPATLNARAKGIA